jgi:hypothetical protein
MWFISEHTTNEAHRGREEGMYSQRRPLVNLSLEVLLK